MTMKTIQLISFKVYLLLVVTHVSNPLSPNRDKYRFSSDDIHTLSRDKVMRINKMIAEEKML